MPGATKPVPQAAFSDSILTESSESEEVDDLVRQAHRRLL
jgi:hypothetical protein